MSQESTVPRKKLTEAISGVTGRFYAGIAAGILALLALSIYGSLAISSILLERKQAELRSLAQTATSLTAGYEQRAKNGEFSIDEAKKRVADILRTMRYNGNDYFVVLDYTNLVVMHPNKATEGKNLSDVKDANGTYVTREQVEAGKGFAVVATEVKDLASQTANATEEISAQIVSVQHATQQTVAAIQEIARTITEMSQISTSIAAAMEEQGAATSEIACNIQEAARGTEPVTGNIVDVWRAAQENGAAAGELLGTAQELSRQSNALSYDVAEFLAGVKVA